MSFLPSQTQLNAVTATKIASSNLERRSVAVKNLDATNTAYIGPPNVTAGTGFPIEPGGRVSFEGHPADVFAISGAGTRGFGRSAPPSPGTAAGSLFGAGATGASGTPF